jgi:hypothetical protein
MNGHEKGDQRAPRAPRGMLGTRRVNVGLPFAVLSVVITQAKKESRSVSTMSWVLIERGLAAMNIEIPEQEDTSCENKNQEDAPLDGLNA